MAYKNPAKILMAHLSSMPNVTSREIPLTFSQYNSTHILGILVIPELQVLIFCTFYKLGEILGGFFPTFNIPKSNAAKDSAKSNQFYKSDPFLESADCTQDRR